MSQLLLNNDSAEPLYRQLEALLKSDIESGEFPAGSKLPTENELVESYHVSRVTVRKALDGLCQQGYLERRSGKGTFVAEEKLQRTLDGVTSFSEMCQEIGCVPGSRTIRRSIELASEKEAEKLGISEDSQIVVIERIRYVDGHPLMLEITKFTEDFIFLMNEDLTDCSLYDLLDRKKGIRFTQSVKMVDIVSAEDMYNAVIKSAKDADIIIKAAAVADYRPSDVSDEKIKKKDGDMSIPLERTKDIIGTLGSSKRDGLFLCGFSMETEHMLDNSNVKLTKKNLDMIVANNVKVAGAGFGTDTNVVTVITKDAVEELPMMSKEEVADALLDRIMKARQ